LPRQAGIAHWAALALLLALRNLLLSPDLFRYCFVIA